MKPEFITLPVIQRQKGVVIDMTQLPLDREVAVVEVMQTLKPKVVGGNHKHARVEWFIGFGDLQLFWIEAGQVQHAPMQHDGAPFLIKIPSGLSHAVVNNSQTETAVVFEFADGPMHNVEKVEVVHVE